MLTYYCHLLLVVTAFICIVEGVSHPSGLQDIGGLASGPGCIRRGAPGTGRAVSSDSTKLEQIPHNISSGHSLSLKKHKGKETLEESVNDTHKDMLVVCPSIDGETEVLPDIKQEPTEKVLVDGKQVQNIESRDESKVDVGKDGKKIKPVMCRFKQRAIIQRAMPIDDNQPKQAQPTSVVEPGSQHVVDKQQLQESAKDHEKHHQNLEFHHVVSKKLADQLGSVNKLENVADHISHHEAGKESHHIMQSSDKILQIDLRKEDKKIKDQIQLGNELVNALESAVDHDKHHRNPEQHHVWNKLANPLESKDRYESALDHVVHHEANNEGHHIQEDEAKIDEKNIAHLKPQDLPLSLKHIIPIEEESAANNLLTRKLKKSNLGNVLESADDHDKHHQNPEQHHVWRKLANPLGSKDRYESALDHVVHHEAISEGHHIQEDEAVMDTMSKIAKKRVHRGVNIIDGNLEGVKKIKHMMPDHKMVLNKLVKKRIIDISQKDKVVLNLAPKCICGVNCKSC